MIRHSRYWCCYQLKPEPKPAIIAETCEACSSSSSRPREETAAPGGLLHSINSMKRRTCLLI